MILVDYEIEKLCELGLVSPYDRALVNSTSLDIRIGNTAMIDTVEGFEKYIGFDKYSQDNPYLLNPNECILVGTLEYLQLPKNISAELKLKSSRAREGLSHALAGWIDSEFCGVLTLELKNYSTKHPVKIYPNLRVGQLILHQTQEPKKSYLDGRYAGKNTVMGSLDAV
jgi:deoxycytidine triphosphate deaminase